MTDIICISPKTFLQAKSTIKVDQKIRDLYETLVSTHACFSSITPQYEPHARVQRQHKHIHSKQHSESRKPISSTTDPLRKVKGLLNLVNTTNFDKVNRKLQFILNDKNAHDVCMLIINTACMQIFFVHVFMRLLNHSIQTTPKITETCVTFVDTFFKNDAFLAIEGSDTQDFADYQKSKKLAINTAVIVMEMIKNQHARQYRVQHFLEHILDKLQQPKNDTEIDLLLSILVEVKKRSTNLKFDKTKLQHVRSRSIDSRLQFMLETLLK